MRYYTACCRCLLLLVFSLFSIVAHAQWVTIPDPNFVAYLQQNFSACMNGNQMDTTCWEIENIKIVQCNARNINDLTGIQYFDAVETLMCYSNNLTFLPPLPDSLVFLNTAENQLTMLPPLPSTLAYLRCADNPPMDSLPTLPAGLQTLDCGFCSVKSLPALPSFLFTLNCHYNQLTSLPALPAGLFNLSAGNNQLTSLPALPVSLNRMTANHNQLTALPPLPGMRLELVYVNSNMITALPSIPQSVHWLDCSDNPISSLPPLPHLDILRCQNMPLLTSIPDLLPDPQLDPMEELFLTNCPNLHCLPELPAEIEDFRFDTSAVRCLPNYPRIIIQSLPPLNSVPLCGVFNTHGCGAFWNINGKAFYDANANCVQDSGEMRVADVKVRLSQGGSLIQQVYTGNQGLYSFNTSLGNYSATIDTAGIPFDIVCPPGRVRNSVLTVADSFDSDMDFGLRCKSGYDVGVWSILAPGNFFPARYVAVNIHAGDIAQLWQHICNTAGLGGQVHIAITGPVTYTSPALGALTPGAVAGNMLTYNIPDWQAINPATAFNVIVQTDTSAQAGQQVCFNVSITPTAGDNNPANNTSTHCFTVVNSFDPNDKQVSPAGDIDITQEWLTYTVRFQNTGTADAQHIYIDDTLDTNLDESTFELLAYSHQPIVQLTQNAVRFNFPNINLPDSTSNEPGSHGYVQYKVKLKANRPLGTQIKNTAAIYFDFNPPVITNTVTSTVTCLAPPVVSIAPASVAICRGGTVTLSANGGNTYVWSSAGNGPTLSVSPPATTTFSVTATDAVGCTASASVTVVVNQPQQGSLQVTICTGDSIFAGGNWVSSPGSYTDSLFTADGCDSITTTTVFVLNASATTFNESACNSYFFNGQTLTASGTYYDTLVNVNGCDSIITLQLTVASGSASSFSQTICTGSSYIFNGDTLTTAGSYRDTLPAANSCDSIITLQLTVTNSVGSTISATICAGDSVFFGSQWNRVSGTYRDTFATTGGCDSIVTMQLNVNDHSTGTATQSICVGESYWFNGQQLAATGNYYDTLASSNGCDSVITLALLVHPLPQAVITQNNDTLYAGSFFSSYQWLQGISVINNATTQSLHITQNGTYSVIVTDGNGCVDTVSYQAVGVGVGELTNDDLRMTIYPNPSRGNFVLEFSDDKAREVIITDVFGKVVLTDVAVQRKKEFSMDEHAAGVYFVRVADGRKSRTVKMIVIL